MFDAMFIPVGHDEARRLLLARLVEEGASCPYCGEVWRSVEQIEAEGNWWSLFGKPAHPACAAPQEKLDDVLWLLEQVRDAARPMRYRQNCALKLGLIGNWATLKRLRDIRKQNRGTPLEASIEQAMLLIRGRE